MRLFNDNVKYGEACSGELELKDNPQLAKVDTLCLIRRGCKTL